MEGTIDPGDAQILFSTDSVEEAVTRIADVGMRRFGLGYATRPRRRWFLGESP